MDPPGLLVVLYNGRYYPYRNTLKDVSDLPGSGIIAHIPPDPAHFGGKLYFVHGLDRMFQYQRPIAWIRTMRRLYQVKEMILETDVYRYSDPKTVRLTKVDEYEENPSALLRLREHDIDYVYIVNLDREVLTMNYCVHWKLSNIPRTDEEWIHDIAHILEVADDDLPGDQPNLSPHLYPEESMRSPALPLLPLDNDIGYPHQLVTAKTNIEAPHKAFFTRVLAEVFTQYQTEIVNFGREWSADSFAFRELAFALVSIASGRAGFYSYRPGLCRNAEACTHEPKCADQRPMPRRCFDLQDPMDGVALVEFGTMYHQEHLAPGAAPTTTMYWVGDVLVSLATQLDGGKIRDAVTWGIEQGRNNFQIVILSLFEAVFVEVSSSDSGTPTIHTSDAIRLSPLNIKYCLSTDPREYAEEKADIMDNWRRGTILPLSSMISLERLQSDFRGLAALVNFFDAAANRAAATDVTGIFPLELYSMILDFADQETWRACSLVSKGFRNACMLRYKIDDHLALRRAPFEWSNAAGEHLVSFCFEDVRTGHVTSTVPGDESERTETWNWVPVLGQWPRMAVMKEVSLEYLEAEEDSDGEMDLS